MIYELHDVEAQVDEAMAASNEMFFTRSNSNAEHSRRSKEYDTNERGQNATNTAMHHYSSSRAESS
jgi:hypothetical protein